MIEQTHRKAEETLEFKMTKPTETFNFNPPIQIKGDCMIGLTDSEIYNSFHNINTINNKFELYTGPLDTELSYTTLKDKVAEVLGLSDFSSDDLENEILSPDIMKIYTSSSMEKSQTDVYYILLRRYLQSPFQDFESYLRILTGLNEDDIQLILKQYSSKFKTYNISPGVYTFKDIAVVLSIGFRTGFEIVRRPDHEYDTSDSFIIDSDDVSLITKLTLKT